MADSLLEFPCAFPLKIIGRTEPALTDTLIAIVIRHAPDFDPATVEMRPSSGRRYLSLTCTVQARSREQLDALYRELTAHPLVVMVI